MDTNDLNKTLKELLSLNKETEWVEFKKDDFNPDDIGKYISALSNSARLLDRNYGFLVYGIKDNNLEVVGTKFDLNKNKIGNEELENWRATQLFPRIDFKIYQFKYNNLPIVIFMIDATNYSPVRFKEVDYIRIGSYTKKLKDYPEKERKLWDKCKKISFEQGNAMSGVSSDKVLRLLNYPTYFQLMNLDLPNNKQGILEKFVQEKLIEKFGSNYIIKNLGAILLANDLRVFDSLYRKTVRVIQYKGIDRNQTIREQNGIKGYAIGYGGLINYINNLLPQNEVIEKVFRKEFKMYPEIAIRELVANALIHQDFYEKGTGPMVEIFEDRIEFTNPGKPLINILRFIDHPPQSRNEKLGFVMRRFRICEERGTGIDKAIFNIEAYQLPAPDFIVGDDFTKIIIYSYRSLRKMDKKDKIRACYQHCCLKYVSRQFMTNKSLRERFGIEEKNYPIVSRIISDTIDSKLIKSEDPSNKANKYQAYIPIWA